MIRPNRLRRAFFKIVEQASLLAKFKNHKKPSSPTSQASFPFGVGSTNKCDNTKCNKKFSFLHRRGPMVPGIPPREASDRLGIFQARFDELWRKYETYSGKRYEL